MGLFKLVDLKNSTYILQQQSNKICLWEVFDDNKSDLKLLLELNSKGDSNIISSGISLNGELIAYSNIEETHIFKYSRENNSIKRIKTLKDQSRFIHFNHKEVILVNNKSILIINLSTYEENKISFDSSALILSSVYSNELNALALIQVKDKSKYHVSLFDLNNNSETIISTLTNQITRGKFINERLFLFDCYNNLWVYCTKTMSLDNKLSNSSPLNFQKWYNKILGIVKISDDKLIAYTDYNFIPINLNLTFPKQSCIERDIISRNKAKSIEVNQKLYHDEVLNTINNSKNLLDKENDENLQKNFKIMTKFISNVFMEYSKDKVIVIEVDWSKILNKMENPIVKHKYGK